jgi:two-component system cell cycle response regulator
METPMTRGATPVLVADDNRVIRRLVSARLRVAGFLVAEASDGVAALAEFERAPVPVVVTDLNMPRLDGLGLLAALRSREQPPEVIVLTGTRASDVEAAVQALRLGAHDYISKAPASLDAVALAVERAVEKWQLRAENARLLGELHRLSLTDGLTGVGNRRAFDEALRQEIARARRVGCDLALALLDIDHFKRVNDTMGHQAGDLALVAFVGRVRSVARDADRLFRYGGEEFALLLSDTDLSGALVLARRIVETVAREPLRSGHDVAVVTCSAGVAELGASDDTLGAELVGRSDAALFAAKGAGRNRAIAFALAANGPDLPPTADEPSPGRHAERC